MNKEQLTKIYPQGIFSTHASIDEEILSLPFENNWFLLPKNNLAMSEIKLLTSLFPDFEEKQSMEKHLWYQYLFQHKPLVSTEHSYRVIQLKLKKESTNAKDWLTHLSRLFNQVEDFFFIDKTTALLIEQKTKIIPQKYDLEGMLLTLENDFLIQSNAYIGNFNESSYDFTSFFAEEKQIFSDYYEEQRKVFSFQDVALDYLTKDKISQSPIMTSLKEAFDLDQEIKEIIKTLWLNQGNITSTSKELYIHRNTLQYRLDKFYERYGLSLKEMKNLTLCYLLID
ncbi:helix-turn-helix domain-containing protein [Vagococcus fluvialis]|uniref:helix-turn-helix domain-containing protein n=1 Tax=Vagococcus fluvialis TaxID=2738 RepID=UPI003B59D145